MEGISLFIVIILGFCIWLYPIVRMARSDRTQGVEKIAWVLITALVFWFAWILYLLIAPIDKKPNTD
ncbi:MAG: hypothetical protein OIF38_09845 [Cellvibrionaceae bacterium]|nr:hypothetical protein [Cellvibrionaceae bacterium]